MKIIPYIKVGDIQLGMSTEEIEKMMKVKPLKFKKNIFDEYFTDDYNTFFAYYKYPGVVEAIEFNNKAKLEFLGKELFKMDSLEIKEFLESIENDIKCVHYSLISLKFGLAITFSDLNLDNKQKPISVLVFEKGYYDGII